MITPGRNGREGAKLRAFSSKRLADPGAERADPGGLVGAIELHENPAKIGDSQERQVQAEFVLLITPGGNSSEGAELGSSASKRLAHPGAERADPGGLVGAIELHEKPAKIGDAQERQVPA